MQRTIEFTLNGMKYRREVHMHWTLLRFLRDSMGLTGAKEGCGNGECGACAVLLDKKPVRSCLVLACEIDGVDIVTIEGLGKGKELDLIQEAFVESGAIQCGFCTSGFVLATKALLLASPVPRREDVIRAFSGHLCRCTGYETLFQAVNLAVRKISAGKLGTEVDSLVSPLF